MLVNCGYVRGGNCVRSYISLLFVIRGDVSGKLTHRTEEDSLSDGGRLGERECWCARRVLLFIILSIRYGNDPVLCPLCTIITRLY